MEMSFSMILCRILVCAALFYLSVEDSKRYEIPPICVWIILGCGIWNVWLEHGSLPSAFLGMCSVSLPLAIAERLSKGRAIGGGDIKLMAAAGVLLGWKRCLLAFVIACIVGSVIHPLCMKWRGAGHVLAFGPYLSFGIFVSLWWGDAMIVWYLERWFL